MVSKFLFVLPLLLSFGLNGADENLALDGKNSVPLNRNEISYAEIAKDANDRAQLRKICELIVSDRIGEAKVLLRKMDYQSEGKLTLISEFLRDYPAGLENAKRIIGISGAGAVAALFETVFFGLRILNGSGFLNIDWLSVALTCGGSFATIAASLLCYASFFRVKRTENLKVFAQSVLNFLDQMDVYNAA